MSTILAVTEIKDKNIRKAGLEVVAQARQVADATGGQVSALVISGPEVDVNPAQLGAYGADEVLVASDAKLTAYHSDYYKQVVLAALQKTAASVVLFPATSLGKDLAPRVAAAAKAVLVSDCTALSWKEDGLAADKPLYAGKVVAQLKLQGDVQMASLRPGVFNAQLLRAGQNAAVANLDLPAFSSKVTLKEIRKKDSCKMDVSDADIIVTGGRGMRSAEGFALLEELAGLLNGAVGATRAVVDVGWRPHDEQVGQTGKVVSPSLYFMCGASGSIQHWAGMSGSKCIVAINKDANAPILQRADYSIVGDVFEVLPVLTEEVRKLRG